jgi:hypothetical protein
LLPRIYTLLHIQIQNKSPDLVTNSMFDF